MCTAANVSLACGVSATVVNSIAIHYVWTQENAKRTRKEIHTHRFATYTTALALMPVDLDMLYTAKGFTIE